MKFLKKNQVIILVIAVMLVAAGYLNYTATTPMNNTIEAAAVAEANKNEEGIGAVSYTHLSPWIAIKLGSVKESGSRSMLMQT